MNHKMWLLTSLFGLGQMAYLQEDFTRAEIYFQQVLVLYKDFGNLKWIVWSTRQLGMIATHQGQIDRARPLFGDSQSLGQTQHFDDQFGDPSGDLAFIVGMGVLAKSQGSLILAARFLGAVEAVLESFFKSLYDGSQIECDRVTNQLRNELDEETFATAWAEGCKPTLEQALEEALVPCRQDAGENAEGV
jgi:hypothetical protein